MLVPIALIAVFVCLEVFVANMPFWRSLGDDTEAGRSSLGPGLVAHPDRGTATVIDPHGAWRDVSSPQPIRYLYLRPAANLSAQSGAVSNQALSWKLSTRKRTDGGWYDATSVHQYSTGAPRSRYLHVGDGANAVRFHYQVRSGDVIPLDDVSVNPRVPYRVDWSRLALEALLIVIILAFRPGSGLYLRPFRALSPRCLAPLAAVFALDAAGIVGLWLVFGMPTATTVPHKLFNDMFFDSNQYGDLAKALLHGRLNLDLPVNRQLAEMPNPYDTATRMRLAREDPQGTPIFFDVAFKSGKYYSYFGVLPAIIAFMPYRALTGQDLPASSAVLAFALVLALCSLAVTVQVARWFSRRGHPVSLGCVLLIASGMLFCTPMFYVLHSEVFYQLPQTLSISLTFLGLCCWIESKLRDLNKGWLLAGCLCMALNLASRPAFVLASLLALPLFWGEIRDLWERGLRGGKGLREEALTWLCALAPYLLVAAPLMAYNAARFGRPLDFGANYNLTAYDIPHSSSPLSQLVPLSLLYFFQPPNLATTFPFLLRTSQDMSPWLPEQASYGGLFTLLAPFTLLIFALKPCWRRLRERQVGAFCALTGAIGLLMYAFTAHTAGYSMRYILDFGWALALVFACCLLAFDSRRSAQGDADDSALAGEIGARSGEGGPLALPDRGPEPEARLAPLSAFSRSAMGCATAGLVIAVLGAFLYVFETRNWVNDQLWWSVNSWFLFV
ncbi:hypothetical protein [Bifidobacterium actinocoloniiforme]|nr:hypothetical protein [Bifidobacterium actinocoloniiforme]AKV55591.1 hypothetical protein AB656_04555 [Bifidobacterium actinocoloniiforme DSM 22766]